MRKKSKLCITISIIFLLALFAVVFSSNPKNKGIENKNSKSNIVTTYRSIIKNNPYSQHVAQGKKLVGKPFESVETLLKAQSEGKVKRVKNSRGVIIDKLTHSKPYLHVDAESLLVEIGKEFYKKSSGSRIVITSLTRPIEKQRELTKSNLNASPNTSSHSYGVSFDIAYTRFNKNRKYSHNDHKVIEEILIKLQAENRILVIREKQSACYHVTVKK
ncbi:MAG: hypothetical protein CVT98_03100 [Bacteroidetes bacterium HGW-Bacteroidetes-15]|nr:MAG: hypothetical protein CVT98_03100 [Bacteroidetes bacterium HGW-Bacteroidetes-15]